MADETREGKTPAYNSYQGLKDFLGELKATAVPPTIDRSLMPKMSGAGQSQVLVALRFLGLIDEKGVTSPDLRALVKAHGTPEWPTTLRPILERSYVTVLAKLHLESGSQKQLTDSFRDFGLADGDMLDRAVRFFVKSMKDAGMTVSPHFEQRRPRGTGRPKAPSAARSAAPDADGADAKDADDADEDPADPRQDGGGARKLPQGLKEWPLTGTHSMWLPLDLNPDDVEMIGDYKALLTKFAARNK